MLHVWAFYFWLVVLWTFLSRYLYQDSDFNFIIIHNHTSKIRPLRKINILPPFRVTWVVLIIDANFTMLSWIITEQKNKAFNEICGNRKKNLLDAHGECFYKIYGLYSFSFGQGVWHRKTNRQIQRNIGIPSACAGHLDLKKNDSIY